MKVATGPANEWERLKAINDYKIPGIVSEADFDDYTRLAADICHTPVSLVCIIDGQHQGFLSVHGVEQSKISGHGAFFAHTISAPDEVLVVEDILADTRFRNDPLIAGGLKIAFYAGAPLVTPEGYAIGTLSVCDYQPRKLGDNQVKGLQSLARQVVNQLELNKKDLLLIRKNNELKMVYADLEQFSYIASHDLKSPLNNIISLTHLLKDNYGSKLDTEGNEYINYLNDTAYQFSNLISGLLQYSMASHLSVEAKEQINVAALAEEVCGLLNIPEHCTISCLKANMEIYSSRIALKQILLNLLQDAIHSGSNIIEVSCFEDKHKWTFEVQDNGPGIDQESQEHIFKLFKKRNNNSDNNTTGIGRAVAKRLVEKLGGEIKVISELDKGSTFTFSIPK
jgi:signal transduction histidine kinase